MASVLYGTLTLAFRGHPKPALPPPIALLPWARPPHTTMPPQVQEPLSKGQLPLRAICVIL